MGVEKYEYAGFMFIVVDGQVTEAEQGQHRSAYKDRHLRAARECYDDYQKVKDKKHPNGAPMFAPDGMMLDDQGNRSIFDDVDQ